MINSLGKTSCCPEQDQCCQDIETSVIANDFKLTSADSSEVLSSNVGHVSTDTRVTFKRVTHTSGSISSGKKITLVHSSTMTTTRRGSGPGVESPIVNLDGHAVFGFDLLNQIPRSGDLFGWVNNLDSLIKDQNVGLQEQQVGANDSSAAHSCCGDQVSSVNNGLNNEAGEEENQNPTASDSTAGSELFNVGHFASFSQMGSIK